MAPQQGGVHPMGKRFFRLSFLLVSIFFTVSALGCGKEWPEDDGYVFYKADGRHKSTGEWLGPIVKTVMDGDTELTVSSLPSANYRADGHIYFNCSVKETDEQYLCFCYVGDEKAKVLYKTKSEKGISLYPSWNPYTKIAYFSVPGADYYLRDGQVIDCAGGRLVSPEGDGKLVRNEDNGFDYVESGNRYELLDYYSVSAINGWMLYYYARSGKHFVFNMKDKTTTELPAKQSFCMEGYPFSFGAADGDYSVVRYWDEKGNAVERPIPISGLGNFRYGGGDRVFVIGDGQWAYDYAYDRLTPCEEGSRGYFLGDFSLYEDDDYRFYTRHDKDHWVFASDLSYRRVDKRTGKDEHMGRPPFSHVGGGNFGHVYHVIPPKKTNDPKSASRP